MGHVEVKLAPSWHMLGRIEAMLSQVGPPWTKVGTKLETIRSKLGQDGEKWRPRCPEIEEKSTEHSGGLPVAPGISELE